MRTLILLFFYLTLNSCVTVKMGDESPKKSLEISYTSPQKPFTDHEALTADKAWISKITGNIISFTSECPKNLDPSLENLSKESLLSLDQTEILNQETIRFNGREALTTYAKGSVDGIPLAMRTLIFKKNGCNYRIMLSGLANKIAIEQTHFEEFCKEFKVP